ncbi:RecA/RadA recombinase [Variovorax boronicumulans]|uniref:hypothetical protein n=1 Tax=Variovorax boronicumulans TaxID=436515 RepID=UPI002785A141|nr:hypothetical protein [Variovorax boronicumulans]MDQ0084490.1 RecA/RadA recombinase [Variovorax boronicumulans]
MSGGISAIKGFDYQAAVTLEFLFEHFESDSEGFVRPEGVDDLVLYSPFASGTDQRFVQIKKPTESRDGVPRPCAWTTADAIRELMPAAWRNLLGTSDRQVWVLGDAADAELDALIHAGRDAPACAKAAFWQTVQALAHNELVRAGAAKDALPTWSPRSRTTLYANMPNEGAAQYLHDAFEKQAKQMGLAQAFVDLHASAIWTVAAALPEVLSRISLRSAYGSEAEVGERVRARLVLEHGLAPEVVEKTLFLNLRGFINEIAKQHGKTFSRSDFEAELRCVWPQMIPIRIPPVLEAYHVPRPDITVPLVHARGITEVIGISGSGKTSLAAEVIIQARQLAGDREVFYAEVRQHVSLRDVLAGVAFHLRRKGFQAPFRVATDATLSEENMIASLCEVLAEIGIDAMLLLDFVEGHCSYAFASQIAKFVQALPAGAVAITIFAQEGVLRLMSPAEREEKGVTLLNVRGLTSREFLQLVAHWHPDPDRALVHRVFQRVTAGRQAGLFAARARALARAPSLDAMYNIASQPAHAVLPVVERMRFATISDPSRSAAEKLVCFALPFSRGEAAQVFRDHHVGVAIQEMLELGLLRSQSMDLLEMHETVRAGLEEGMALGLRETTHLELANWYRLQGVVTAEVLHLEKAGRFAQAAERARNAFLQGGQWGGLANFVVARKLVSPEEVIAAVADAGKKFDHLFILPRILQDLGLESVDSLIGVLDRNPGRFASDHAWGGAIVETILKFDPSRLHELVEQALRQPHADTGEFSALGVLAVGMRRARTELPPATLSLLDAQTPQVQREMLPMLVQDKRRGVLQRVLRVHVDDVLEAPRNGRRQSPRSLYLRLDTHQEVIEFLAAFPMADSGAMLAAKSALLGPLVDLVSSLSAALRPACVALLGEADNEPHVLTNAFRILCFLADERAPALCEALILKKPSLAALSALIPALLPAFCDPEVYEARLLDNGLGADDRLVALGALSTLGVDLGPVHARFRRSQSFSDRPDAADPWDALFLLECARSPFKEGIEILKQQLAASDGSSEGDVLSPGLLWQLGELPGPESTSLLLWALDHKDVQIRRMAAAGLQRRRTCVALPSLVRRFRSEDDHVVALLLAVAMVASGARQVSMLDHPDRSGPEFMLWRCILAMRLGDQSAADMLVRLAIDPAQGWQIRRVAILAAGRLPYELALRHVHESLRSNGTTILEIDRSVNLVCHVVMIDLLKRHGAIVREMFLYGRQRFVDFFAPVFDSRWQDAIFPEGIPSGENAAGWLFDRLGHHDWGRRPDAVLTVIDELHFPLLRMDTIRSLRLQGKVELIVQALEQSDCEWFAVKCIKEVVTAKGPGPETDAFLTSLVERSAFGQSVYVGRVISRLSQREDRSTAPVESSARPPNAHRPRAEVAQLTFDEVSRLLVRGEVDPPLPAEFVLAALSAAQHEELERLLNPARDPEYGVSEFRPVVSFTSGGHVVTEERTSYRGEPACRPRLRAALAAANRFGQEVSWHGRILGEAYAPAYRRRVLEFLGWQGDAERFYEEIFKHPDTLGTALCNVQHAALVGHLIDARIVPLLDRYITSGTREFFEGMCSLASRVTTPEIDRVLSRLLHRWTQELTVPPEQAMPETSHFLWRGFRLLTMHPRFMHVATWHAQLTSVLNADLAWWNRQDVVMVLAGDPRSYIQLECLLFNAADFEHFPESELERLDAVCERLFGELEQSTPPGG